MIEADRVDHSRAKLDHDLIVPITTRNPRSATGNWKRFADSLPPLFDMINCDMGLQRP